MREPPGLETGTPFFKASCWDGQCEDMRGPDSWLSAPLPLPAGSGPAAPAEAVRSGAGRPRGRAEVAGRRVEPVDPGTGWPLPGLRAERGPGLCMSVLLLPAWHGPRTQAWGSGGACSCVLTGVLGLGLNKCLISCSVNLIPKLVGLGKPNEGKGLA